jgi:hypothetical protein
MSEPRRSRATRDVPTVRSSSGSDPSQVRRRMGTQMHALSGVRAESGRWSSWLSKVSPKVFGPGASRRQLGNARDRRSPRRRRSAGRPAVMTTSVSKRTRVEAARMGSAVHVRSAHASGPGRGEKGGRQCRRSSANGFGRERGVERACGAPRARPQRETPARGTGRRRIGFRPDDRRRHGRRSVWRRTRHAGFHRREARRRGNPPTTLPPPHRGLTAMERAA